MAGGPTIKMTDKITVDVVDPDDVAPVYADLITEFREADGIVYISLASLIVEGDANSSRKARVVARIRLSRARASVLYGLIGNLLNKKSRPKEAAH